MRHATRATMTLIALGEDVGDGEREHVQACPACADAMAYVRRQLLRIHDAGASAEDIPPPSVWEGIHRRLDLDEGLRADPLAPVPGSTSVAGAPGSRRGVRHRRVLIGAAAVVVVAGGVWSSLSAMHGSTSDAPDPKPWTIATAHLAPIGAHADSGNVRLDLMPDGERILVVHCSGTTARGYREVWLLTADATGMVSLGSMEGADDEFRLPDDVDIASLPVVDISSEPDDGDPTHSGVSIVRGSLHAG